MYNLTYTFADQPRPKVRGVACSNKNAVFKVPGSDPISLKATPCALTSNSEAGTFWYISVPISDKAVTAAFLHNGTTLRLYNNSPSSSDIVALMLCMACAVSLAIRRGIQPEGLGIQQSVPMVDVASATAMASFVYGQSVLRTLHDDSVNVDLSVVLYYSIVALCVIVIFLGCLKSLTKVVLVGFKRVGVKVNPEQHASYVILTPVFLGMAVDTLLLITIHAQVPASILGSTPKHALGASIACGLLYELASSMVSSFRSYADKECSVLCVSLTIVLAVILYAYCAVALVYPAASSGSSQNAMFISFLICSQAFLAGLIEIGPITTKIFVDRVGAVQVTEEVFNTIADLKKRVISIVNDAQPHTIPESNVSEYGLECISQATGSRETLRDDAFLFDAGISHGSALRLINKKI